MEPLDLRQPLSNALQLLESRFRRDGMIATLDVPAELPLVWGSESQLEQVFVNLLVNAWQAMAAGGNITIQADVVEDRCVRIAFRDTGKGMSTPALAHAFEPFFTTKMSAGTGLGLAICQQIVESHHGSIALESVPGEGTTVTIDLLQVDTPHPRMTA
jgi:two-component system NtrC family sensor kinase